MRNVWLWWTWHRHRWEPVWKFQPYHHVGPWHGVWTYYSPVRRCRACGKVKPKPSPHQPDRSEA